MLKVTRKKRQWVFLVERPTGQLSAKLMVDKAIATDLLIEVDQQVQVVRQEHTELADADFEQIKAFPLGEKLRLLDRPTREIQQC